jgi:hypothetical protein
LYGTLERGGKKRKSVREKGKRESKNVPSDPMRRENERSSSKARPIIGLGEGAALWSRARDVGRV